ncbi:CBN-LST-3 protein [Caenorhabditis brenneri]|uniref:SAP domain-containing ribonucleoprotein n=1 Tax=Caenorhabditis brenneri TaxID=135651 RepID=G0P9M6_CAEBE|nr:CBN-LST-3 protein [Caenorhabditis brenneri]
MSQFGGGRPPGQWQRPAAPGGAPQLSGFPAVNFGGVPMVGMGVPMGMVNQAAFSSPNVLGMQGIMGAVPQQSLTQQQPSFQQQNGLQQGANAQQNAGAKNQRTFVGVVTKMLDTYGFVDDDVFFQHSVIRGSHPRVGDKVMVEANYNPSMPFKWNAYRIQLLNAATQQEPVRQAPQQQQIPQQRAQDSQRWGSSNTGGNDRDRNGARGNESPLHRSAQPRRHSPPPRRASPPRRTSPKRDARPARESREPREPRRSPPPRRPSPRRASPSVPAKSDRKREREKSPAGSVAQSVRRDSASPPRRRARIIPRYECRIQKPAILAPVTSGSLVRQRYSKLYIPSDCVDLSFEWVRSVQLDMSLDLNNPIQFHVFNKDVDYFGEPLPVFEPEDADHRHQVKVLLLSHAGKSEVVKKSFCLMADGTTDDHQEPQSLLKNLHFLVGVRGKETMGIGGSWSPSLDGADPHSATTMIRTAVRTTHALTGIDLSSVSQWFTMVTIRYYRADKQRIDHVNFLLPDTQSLAIDDAKWAEAEQKIGEQLKAKLAEIDAMKIEEAVVEPVKKEEENVVEMVDAAASEVTPDEVKKEEESKDEHQAAKESIVLYMGFSFYLIFVEDADVSMTSDNGEAPAVEEGQGPTNWSKLDPKSMKVAELRVELELRGLETKGIKTLLVQRLQTALDSEKSTEAAAAKDVEMKEPEPVKQEAGEENPAAFIAPPIEETKAKTEAEAKKEQEEADKRKKKEEQLEKEKKEKREALEKHYQLPKDKKILVFPSKTFKSGKFDCKVLSLSSLLDYRHDDNKENQFEVSLFAEAFKEMVERNAAFTIYETLVNCGDKDAEKKRRDEARERTVEVPVEKPAEKPAATENAEKPADEAEKSEEQKETKKDEKEEKKEEEKKEKKERVEVKSIVANRTVYEAFSLFDMNLCGYLTEKDIEDILHNGEFGISRGQIQKLSKKLSVRDKINYRHLTDVLTDMDGNVRHTPGGADDVVETDDLIRGFGVNLAKSLEPEHDGASAQISSSSDGVVIINGSAVNVVQKLKQLKQLEKERDEAKATVNEQISLIEQLREAKADIEKKKKDIDSHYHKSNKKLNETTAQLKTTQDDNASLKLALQDCKRHADRIFSVVEKAMPPPPKKEEKKEEKKKEEKSEKKDTEKEKSPQKTEEGAATTTPAEPIAVVEASEGKDEVDEVEEAKA